MVCRKNGSSKIVKFNNMKKFLITGTFESGKTTLTSLFRNTPGVAIVEEVARDILSVNPNLATEPIFHELNFAEQLRRERNAEASSAHVILCERGILDIIAYANVFQHPVDPQWNQALQNRYDKIFIFNKDDVSFDSTPEENMFRNAIDKEIRKISSQLGIPILEVKGTLEERRYLVGGFVCEEIINKEGSKGFLERGL